MRRGVWSLASYGIMTATGKFLSTVYALSLADGLLRLQAPHPARTPKETLEELAVQWNALMMMAMMRGSNSSGGDKLEWDIADVYGDFDKTAAESFLRAFEHQVAHDFQKEDAVFVPSGVMAQSIALLIHHSKKIKDGDIAARSPLRFLCHATSHLLLHEHDGYRELCGMEAISLPQARTSSTSSIPGTGLGAPPLLFEHVYDCLQWQSQQGNGDDDIFAILLELPHRELGGKITPWEDILKIKEYATAKGLALHCDGARIFEATTGYNGKTVAELTKPFDSVYISFYKGLGGLSGAMLLGTKEFCQDARIWLRRFGGNLYTLLPYVVSGWSGYTRNWIQPSQEVLIDNAPMSFQEKKEKLVRLAEAFSSNDVLSQVLSLEPAVPQVPLVHFYLRTTFSQSEHIRDRIQHELGVSIFHRLTPVNEDSGLAFQKGYRCKFELSIGEANGAIPDEMWITAWDRYGREALQALSCVSDSQQISEC